jgi:hypothetical protein
MLLLGETHFYGRNATYYFSRNPGADVHDVEQIVEDHLKTLIVQNFDAKKADSIFTEEGGVSLLK